MGNDRPLLSYDSGSGGRNGRRRGGIRLVERLKEKTVGRRIRISQWRERGRIRLGLPFWLRLAPTPQQTRCGDQMDAEQNDYKNRQIVLLLRDLFEG